MSGRHLCVCVWREGKREGKQEEAQRERTALFRVVMLAWVCGGRGWLQAQIHLLLRKLPAWGVTTHSALRVRDL